MSLGAGVRLGPYELLEPLGRGGMGQVWKARDIRLDRIVAIKRLDAPHSHRFEQEARAIAALNHPHICQIHDVGPDYLVLEFVDGAPPTGPLPLGEVLNLANQIASALEEAHSRGILHRDLKPANIMVTTRGTAKLLDFGLAKLLDPSADVTRTMEGGIVGTTAYMSPEQAEGKPLDARSDVFSFGAVLYELAAGRRAFAGTTTVQVLNAVMRGDPPPLDEAPSLDRVVRRCLKKHPPERFQTVADVRAALAQVSAKDVDLSPSIAVLPFTNISADKENEYFSDGLAEDILNALTRVHGLRVMARTSSFVFRSKDQDIRRIGEALGVRTVLEGSVRRAGNRLRITAQLIAAVDGSHLWSERFDREMTDVFAVQDEIAQSIVETLKIKLGTDRPLASRPTTNVEAYHAYLKGRHLLLKMNPDDLARSRASLEEAIGLDPAYAPAYSALAHALQLSAFMGWTAATQAQPLAKAAARQALEHDGAEPEAHFVLALVAAQFDYDWPAALRHCRLALESGVAPPDVVGVLATVVLLPLGHVGEAMEVLQRARNVDPLSPFPQQHYAFALLAGGCYQAAIEQLEQQVGLHEMFWPNHFFLGGAYLAQGRIREATETLEKAFRLMPAYYGVIGLLAAAHALGGDRARADALLATLTSHSVGQRALGLGLFHMACAEFEQAATHFEQAIDQRQPSVTQLSVWPFGAAFRESPPGRALIRKIHLPTA